MKKFIVLTIIAVLFTACAPVEWSKSEKVIFTTAKTLEVASQFRVTGLSAAGDVYKVGLMKEDLKNRIIELGDKLQAAINTTSQCLEIYMQTGTGVDTLQEQVLMYQQIYGEFSDLVLPYLMEGKNNG